MPVSMSVWQVPTRVWENTLNLLKVIVSEERTVQDCIQRLTEWALPEWIPQEVDTGSSPWNQGRKQQHPLSRLRESLGNLNPFIAPLIGPIRSVALENDKVYPSIQPAGEHETCILVV